MASPPATPPILSAEATAAIHAQLAANVLDEGRT